MFIGEVIVDEVSIVSPKKDNAHTHRVSETVKQKTRAASWRANHTSEQHFLQQAIDVRDAEHFGKLDLLYHLPRDRLEHWQ